MDAGNKIPGWLEDPMRGLAFWLGYHHIRFRHYPLTEGAISGELIALIHASRPKEIGIAPETMYSEIATGDFRKTRADFVVGALRKECGETKAVPDGVQVVVEVKRSTTWPKVEEDLRRLVRFLYCSRASAPRAFLIVAYQARRPHEQLTIRGANGAYRATRNAIEVLADDGLKGLAHVRRVVRASSRQQERPDSSTTTTHHVCLVEVKKSGGRVQLPAEPELVAEER